MSILVTGGAGYIGSHVVLSLLEAGYEVTVLDDLSLGCRENVDPRAQFIEGSTLRVEDLEHCFQSPVEAVVHLAAFKAAGESMVQPAKYSTNNLNGTVNLLNATVEHGVDVFVFSSSAAVYGYPQYLPIDEDHPLDPINYYGFTKLTIEELLKWYHQLKGLRFAALRYFNAAGYDPQGRITGLEQNPANLLPVDMEVAVGKRSKLKVFGDDYETPDGTGVRDYIHVNDLAVAHVQALQYLQREKKTLTINLGTGGGYSVLDVVNMAREVTGEAIPYEVVDRRPGDPDTLIAASNQAAQILGWSPQFSDLKTILQSMWQVYRPLMSVLEEG
jgi:UDP-glucose 4-epimerase